MRMLHQIVAVATALLLVVAAPAPAQDTPPDNLLTEAERSNYTATARYDQIVELCLRLSTASKFIHIADIGKTVQGRSIPLMIVSDPLIKTPEEAARSGKLVVLLIGNIHAGEVEGKEALPMLVRDLVMASALGDQASDEQKAIRALLNDLILLVVPIYNADGNENLGPIAQKRPGQNGPTGGDGVGTRENADALDLNRDYVKLESPEARGLVSIMRKWDPAVFIDTHTTNGSYHRYTLTYMGPTNPAGDKNIIEFTRDKLLPDVGKKVEERTGYKSYFYGNLEGRDADGGYTKWTTYPDQPRYGGPYFGLRNRISILTEAYTYAPFKDRVLSTKEFCRASLEYIAANKNDIKRLLREADETQRKLDVELPIRTEARAFDQKTTILGYVEELKDGKRVRTDQTRDYAVDLINNFVPTVSVKRAFAYVYPRELSTITENLQRHGVEVEELREDLEIDFETYTIESVTKAMRPFQKHDLVDVNASASTKSLRLPAGTMVVRTAQKLGTLASFLLEPRSSDGLTTWNFFDDALKLGEQFPVMRVTAATHMLTCATRPLAEDREMGKKITFETLYNTGSGGGRRGGGGGGGINLSGSPLGGFRWLEDGEHYTLVRDGKVTRVNALTGRASGELFDRQPIVDSLLKLPTFPENTAKSLGNASFLNTDPARKGALFAYENDLYYAAIDGSGAKRLTSTPEAEEDVSWSPDGNFVAFTRSYDLYVVDVATANERRLTTGGTETLRNAKNDWVYFEELYGRSWRAYWWSPDSRRIAFLQIDSSKVPIWTIAVDHDGEQRLEQERYPRPGEPNPSAKLGVVSVAGGNVRWADLAEYDDGNFLITWAGWLSPKPKPGEKAVESTTAFCCIQNRTQTWMDIIAIPAQGGAQKKLLRETTEAWVEPQGDPYVLKDGSFILASERDGYRHLYLHTPDGKLKNRITDGKFEARSIAHVDEDNGLLYYTSTEQSWIGNALYRIRFDGTDKTLLTSAPVGPMGDPPLGARSDAVGGHSISFSPSGKYFIDSWSDWQTPTRVALYDNKGSLIRTLDTNPVYAIEEYTRGTLERLKIPMPDGFELEATILKPPGFSEGNKYPVWLMTYAGPHAPTVSDSWGGGRTYDEMLANTGDGIIVFRVDPRSASGKGAVSAWSAYKQLGVPELKDLEAAVEWLAKNPWIDASRVGIAGGSYGGFMTAYALTHSKTFSAGIATASVTDWRDYDSIYTERYMLTPQENPDGYDKTSVVKAAREGKLHGRLLLVHGTSDDNVHAANSIKLISALQQAPGGNSQFDFMLYPGSRHGVGGDHVRNMNFNFIREHLLGEKPAAATTTEEPQNEARPRRGSGRRGAANSGD